MTETQSERERLWMNRVGTSLSFKRVAASPAVIQHLFYVVQAWSAKINANFRSGINHPVVLIGLLLISSCSDEPKQSARYTQFDHLCKLISPLKDQDLENAKRLARIIMQDGGNLQRDISFSIGTPTPDQLTPITAGISNIKGLYVYKLPVVYRGKVYFYQYALVLIDRVNEIPFYGMKERRTECDSNRYYKWIDLVR
jgi:hypothetical protein